MRMDRKGVAVFGEIAIDFDRMELQRAGQTVPATGLEFRLLKLFVDHPGYVFSREELIRAAWPKRKRATHRTVDTSISHLRRKLEGNPTEPVMFQTVFGVGYKFVPHSNPRRIFTSA